MPTQSDLVTVGVPVFRADDTVAEALGSIQRQTYRNLDVVISVDGNDGRSAERCKPFLSDSRFRLVMQKRRLGWAGNLNTLIAGCAGEFFLYHAQDDHTSVDFISDLHAAARKHPGSSICYGAMEMFGTERARVAPPSIVGDALARLLSQIELLESRPFLGLMRAKALQATKGVKIYPPESFAADMVLTAELAMQGDLLYVPGPTYYKRISSHNTHMKWYRWSIARKRKAWTGFGAALLEAALQASHMPDQRHHLFETVLDRLLSSRGGQRWMFGDIDSAGADERQHFISELLALARSRGIVDLSGLMGQNWTSVTEMALLVKRSGSR